MGFFTHEAMQNAGGTKYINESFEQVLEDSTSPAEQEDLIEAGIDAIIATNENYNMIMRRTAILESMALEETGQEYVYTEGVLGSLYNTIKSFLNKIWEKIKGLFKRFMMTIDSYTKNDKDFCTKYRKQIFAKTLDSDFTFKGYKWNINMTNLKSAIGACSTESGKAFKTDSDRGTLADDTTPDRGLAFDSKANADKNSDKESDIIEKLNGTILKVYTGKEHGAMTVEEFRKELHESFRGDTTEKEELDSKDIDVSGWFNELMTSNQTRKDAKTSFDESRKAIDQDLKALDRMDKERINQAGKYSDEYYSATDADGLQSADLTTAAAAARAAGASDTDLQDSGADDLTKVKDWIKAHPNKVVKKTKAKSNEENDLKGRRLHWFTKVSNATKTCLLTINSEFLNALKERSRQYKACMIAVVHYKSKNEAMEESYYMAKSNFVGTGIFNGIQFK